MKKCLQCNEYLDIWFKPIWKDDKLIKYEIEFICLKCGKTFFEPRHQIPDFVKVVGQLIKKE